MDFKLSKRKIIPIVVVLIIVVSAVCVFYDLNGKSFDTHCKTRIIITDSMASGDHYAYECPDCGYSCSGDASSDICPDCGTKMDKCDGDIGEIPVHAMVMIRTMSASDMDSIHVGDVISFMNTSTQLQTVHRVTKIVYDGSGNLEGFVTEGDKAGLGSDGEVLLSNVEGKVVGESAFIGSLVHFIQSSTIFFIMIVVIIIVIISVIMDIYKMQKKDRAMRKAAEESENGSDDEDPDSRDL